MITTGLYIHWPFCAAKCPYCDFNSHVAAKIDEQVWADAYLKTLAHYADLLPDRTISSIFFGGGTPSLMNPKTADAIISALHKHWPVANDIEITLEANPTSVEAEKFKAFKAAGVNRVSMGVQSLNDVDLKFLGREHSAAEALKAVNTARSVFDRYSFDLIYARPEQTLKAWEAELKDALTYINGHMSLYQLTIERGTPFYTFEKDGRFVMPDNDLAADFYMLTQEIMNAAGLPAYEVSNHAAAGQESRHNMIYWRYDDYIGIGPGAHGHITLADGIKYATRAHKTPAKWLDKVSQNGHGAHPFQAIAPQDQFAEALMVGLRLSEGIDLEDVSTRTGWRWQDSVSPAKIQTLCDEELLIQSGTHITATVKGRLQLNALIGFLL